MPKEARLRGKVIGRLIEPGLHKRRAGFFIIRLPKMKKFFLIRNNITDQTQQSYYCRATDICFPSQYHHQSQLHGISVSSFTWVGNPVSFVNRPCVNGQNSKGKEDVMANIK